MDTPTTTNEGTDWTRRRKHPARCLARDLRLLAPVLFVAFCLAVSVFAIELIERAPASPHAVEVAAR